MKAKIVFEPHIPTALRRAFEYAGSRGFVASMPQLLAARASAPYDNLIWNTWFTANSEESVVTTPHGNHVVVAINGGGILASPDRIEQSLHANQEHSSPDGLTGQTAIKISTKEAQDLLKGKLPDGSEVPLYSFDELRQGIRNLPIRHGVILDYELARKSRRGYEYFDILKDDPNMIVRAGGVEALAAYLDRFRKRHDTERMGNWHPYNRIDPDQPQTRIPFLAGNRGGIDSDKATGFGYDEEYGLGGDASTVGMARYVAVAPSGTSVNLRDIDFEH